MEDSKIVDLYWKRDETAISETRDKYRNYLMKIAYNILAVREDCEESVNDTYLKAWNSMPPNRPTRLGLYLGKITRELSIDIFRKRQAKKRGGSEMALSLDELQDCVAGGTSPEEHLDVKELAASIGKYLRTRTKQKRDVFVCRYYFLDPVLEIADKFGMSESKVKNILLRERKGLRAFLEKEGYEF